ncbi:nucleotidyltransferase domain-containing protein [Gordonia sp. FQ]|uniref:nucleotidyltransferase domain-containing protein n=1 Tax=Gordonia sp. FQ TaxID=3446634 RepID=UPI003F85B344
MRLQNPFAAVGSTGIDSQVLTVLARSENYYTVAEIHRLVPEGGSSPGIRNSVQRLVEQGTVVERVVGERGHAYALNREHLLIGAILQIADAKSELVSRLARRVDGWATAPLVVALFGSGARGDMRTDSDIDVLVVLPDSADASAEEAVQDLAAEAGRWTGNDVRPLVFRDSEVRPSELLRAIVADGIHIAGDRTWLRRAMSRTGDGE